MSRHVDSLAREVPTLRDIYDEHTGLRDRFAGAGTLAPELAAWLGVVGLADVRQRNLGAVAREAFLAGVSAAGGGAGRGQGGGGSMCVD